MRLTCPTCGATYEIDDALIPSGGRDVQCSNCDATWFQLGPPRRAASVAPLRSGRDDDAGDDRDDDDAAAGAERGAAPEDAPSDARSDPVFDILREEREYETRARRAERDARGADDDSGPAVDPALGRMLAGGGRARPGAADDDGPGSAGSRERARIAAAAALARARDRDPPRAVDAAARQPADRHRPDRSPPTPTPAYADPPAPDADRGRRDRLPEIARAGDGRRRAGRETRRDRPDGRGRASGFRTGFLTVVVVAAALALAYAFAPEIVEAIPDLAEPMAGYVAFVDEQRVAIARGAEALTVWLENVTG